MEIYSLLPYVDATIWIYIRLRLVLWEARKYDASRDRVENNKKKKTISYAHGRQWSRTR